MNVAFAVRLESLMDTHSASQTSPTLLARLRQGPDDQAAWNAFVDRYGPKIYGWCRQWKLQEADAQDVTQDVLLRLAQKLRTFAYDASRSFRGWLRTLTRHAWSDFLAARQRAGPGCGGSQVLEILQAAEAREDLVTRLEQQFDLELMEEASARVQLRVEPQTWEAFRLTALEGLSGEAAAQQLGVRVTAVFKAKSRVQELLRNEITTLEREP
jgi:RNA polymerase sigma-70 factor (ECF subfamily)